MGVKALDTRSPEIQCHLTNSRLQPSLMVYQDGKPRRGYFFYSDLCSKQCHLEAGAPLGMEHLLLFTRYKWRGSVLTGHGSVIFMSITRAFIWNDWRNYSRNSASNNMPWLITQICLERLSAGITFARSIHYRPPSLHGPWILNFCQIMKFVRGRKGVKHS